MENEAVDRKKSYVSSDVGRTKYHIRSKIELFLSKCEDPDFLPCGLRSLSDTSSKAFIIVQFTTNRDVLLITDKRFKIFLEIRPYEPKENRQFRMQ